MAINIGSNIADALGGMRIGPSDEEKALIMRALLLKRENAQQQMEYTGLPPVEQEAGVNFLQDPNRVENLRGANVEKETFTAPSVQGHPWMKGAEKVYSPKAEETLMGAKAAATPPLFGKGQIGIKKEEIKAAAKGTGKAPQEETEWGKILRNTRSAQGLGAMAPIPMKESIVESMALDLSKSMGYDLDPDGTPSEEAKRTVIRKLKAANDAIGK